MNEYEQEYEYEYEYEYDDDEKITIICKNVITDTHTFFGNEDNKKMYMQANQLTILLYEDVLLSEILIPKFTKSFCKYISANIIENIKNIVTDEINRMNLLWKNDEDIRNMFDYEISNTPLIEDELKNEILNEIEYKVKKLITIFHIKNEEIEREAEKKNADLRYRKKNNYITKMKKENE